MEKTKLKDVIDRVIDFLDKKPLKSDMIIAQHLIKELKEIVELLELIDWLDLIRKNYPTGSYTPEQSDILSERLKQQNQPTKASDLSIFKNKSPK